MQKMNLHINEQILRLPLEQDLDQIRDLGYWNLYVIQ